MAKKKVLPRKREPSISIKESKAISFFFGGMTQGDALRAAGYPDSVARNPSQVFGKEPVAAQINKIRRAGLAQVKADHQETMAFEKKVLRTPITEIVDIPELKKIDRNTALTIRKITVVGEGKHRRVSVETYDKQKSSVEIRKDAEKKLEAAKDAEVQDRHGNDEEGRSSFRERVLEMARKFKKRGRSR